MTPRNLASLAVLTFLLCACGVEVPADKSDYVGLWRSETGDVTLNIAQGGRVNYVRKRGSSETEINAPIQSWQDEDFDVGLAGVTTRFDVQVPPHDVGDRMRMTVDGVQLTRADDRRIDVE